MNLYEQAKENADIEKEQKALNVRKKQLEREQLKRILILDLGLKSRLCNDCEYSVLVSVVENAILDGTKKSPHYCEASIHIGKDHYYYKPVADIKRPQDDISIKIDKNKISELVNFILLDIKKVSTSYGEGKQFKINNYGSIERN